MTDSTLIPESPSAGGVRYFVYPNRTIWNGKPLAGFDVVDDHEDGRVVYRRVATQEHAQKLADALNAGAPEPKPKVRRGPNVYPVGWAVWDEGIHFKTVAEIETYVTRLYSSAWFLRYYGNRLAPDVEKQRGEGGHGGTGALRIGFKGGYARQVVVLHEVAHEITIYDLSQAARRAGKRTEVHGSRFNRVWLELMRHEMGIDMDRRLRALFKEYRVRLGSPTKPVYTPQVARDRAVHRAIDRVPDRPWRFEVIIERVKHAHTFIAPTLFAAMLQATARWRTANPTRLSAWKGRATPVKKPVRRAANGGRS